MFRFDVTDTDGAARRGVLTTAHGVVNTPAFMAVGTQGAVIQGIVRDAAGQSVARAAVVLVPDFAKRKSSFLYKRTITNSAGQFSVRGLAPGDYQVFAWPSPPPQGAEEDPVFLEPVENRGTTVRATSGVTTEANVRVIQ